MKKKKNLILIGVLLVVSIGSTYAYFVSKVILNGSGVDINTSDIINGNGLVAVRIKSETGEYEKVKNIPLNGYILNEEKSYCGIKHDDGVYSKEEVNIIYKSGKVTIDKVNKNGIRCFLYFDKASCKGVACETILANNSVDTSRISGEFTSTFEEDTNGRIFKGPEDDYGEYTYFFAGASPNNWVIFADKWWRIIRINGNGSVRIIYAGSDSTKTPTPTGEDTRIGTSAFNTIYNDNAYVGYMYGTPGSDNYNDTHANINSSVIKVQVDSWYSNNIENNSEYVSHIDTSVGFCGDRKISNVLRSGYGTLGYEKNATVYSVVDRLMDNNWAALSTQKPSLKCSQNNDLYTVSSANRGNRALIYPIGLITIDEVAYAGGYRSLGNTRYWLYTGQNYWTMSPASYYDTRIPGAFYTDSNNGLENGSVGRVYDIRPVINLRADTVLTGSGTTTEPYVVS